MVGRKYPSKRWAVNHPTALFSLHDIPSPDEIAFGFARIVHPESHPDHALSLLPYTSDGLFPGIDDPTPSLAKPTSPNCNQGLLKSRNQASKVARFCRGTVAEIPVQRSPSPRTFVMSPPARLIAPITSTSIASATDT